MSAMKDSNQAPTFIYTNFYNLYRKSKFESDTQPELLTGVVLTTAHTQSFAPTVAEVRVVSHHQMEQLSQWSHSNLSSHFRSLNESRKRLKFLTSEIDDILKKS